jgi:hypothetical protein
LILIFCKDLSSGWSFNIGRNAGYMFSIFLKTLGQVLVCYKLDQDQAGFSAGLALVPWWLLLVMVVGDVTVTVVKDATSGLGQDILS